MAKLNSIEKIVEKLEEWRDVKDYEGFYQVSDWGRVKSLARWIVSGRAGIVLRKEKIVIHEGPGKTGGYKNIGLWKDKKVFYIRVHKLVLETFVCSKPKGTQCCHNDGKPWNNRVENLRWDTPKNNQADRIKHGTTHYGNKCWNFKVTDEMIEQIRDLYIPFKVTMKQLAEQFKLNLDTIDCIVNRRGRFSSK